MGIVARVSDEHPLIFWRRLTVQDNKAYGAPRNKTLSPREMGDSAFLEWVPAGKEIHPP